MWAEAIVGVERVFGDERFYLSDEPVVATKCEVGLDPERDRREPDLLEPGDGRLRKALVGEVRKRRASPQRQRIVKPLRSICCQTSSQQASPLVNQALEAVEVEVVRFDPEGVAGRSRRQHVLRKRLAKSRHVDPQCGGRALG